MVAMPTILCIDDEPIVLELQKEILQANGYTVLSAPDGPTAIALASKHPLDLVVLDYKMPGMDGGQVAEVLLAQQPDLPIVLCTGFLDAVPEWLKWFAAGCFHKGDGPTALLSAIQEVISKKKAPSQASDAQRILKQSRVA